MVTPLFTDYAVTWNFVNPLCGSVPQDPEIVAKWLESRMPTSKPAEGRDLIEIQEEVLATLSEPAEPHEVAVLGFQSHGPGLAVRGATIRAHLKDCARQLSRYVVGKIKGETSFAVRVVNTVYVRDEWVSITRPDGQHVLVPDGHIEKPFSAMTPRGPISAFKRFAYVEPASLRFSIRVLGGAVGKDDLERIMQYGGLHGYAGERGMGYGRYVIEQLDTVD